MSTDIFVYNQATGDIISLTEAGNDGSYAPAISADGSTIAFVSQSTNLAVVPGDTEDADIFILSLSTGQFTNLTGHLTVPGGMIVQGPDSSGDGTKIVFSASDSTFSGSMLYDAVTGQFTAISAGTNPDISSDGSTIILTSYDLAAGKTDILTYNVRSQETVNLTSAANGTSFYGSVSGDGAWVVFQSAATNLGTEPDLNGFEDVFVFNAATGETINLTAGANGTSAAPVVSADGQTIAFMSTATNLDPDAVDTNGDTDIFVYQVATREFTNITAGGDSWSRYPVLSDDGSAVSFVSYATNLDSSVRQHNGQQNVFVYDLF